MLPALALAAAAALPFASGFTGAIFSTQQLSGRPIPAARRCCEGLSTLRAGVATPVKTGGGGGNDDQGGGGGDARDDAVQLPWPKKELRVKDYSLGAGEIAVRFINAPGRYPSGNACASTCAR